MKVAGLAYLLISIAYVATGELGMLLALPPGYASPVFLPAGIAVAAVLIGGRKTLPWIFFGSLLLNVWIGYSANHQVTGLSLLVAAFIAMSSVLQATIGGWGLQRVLGQPAGFDTPAKFLRFLMLSPVICLVSASLSVSGLLGFGIIEGSAFASNWGAWWLGDTLGVIIMVPLILTVSEAPTDGMKARLRTVTIPILLVLFTGFLAVYFLQQAAFDSAHKARQAAFEYQSGEVVLRIEQRLATYEQVLRGAKGLFAASKSVDREEFRDYVATQNLSARHPGIQGVGFSPVIAAHDKARHIESIRKQGFTDYTIWPGGERDLYTPVVYLEPFSGSNLRVLGYDVYSESVRRAAMEKARDQDRTVMSGKLKLMQDSDEDGQAGFLMYLPVFRNGLPHATEAERRANIVGWVSAPFRMGDLMQGLLGEQVNHIDLEIYDGTDATPATQMYDSNTEESHPRVPLYSTSSTIEIMGHHWVIKQHSLQKFEDDLNMDRIAIIRISGISITLLLAILVWQLAIGRTRALNLAQGMTAELRESTARVEMLLHSVAEGIYGVDMQGNCTFINSAGLAMLGYEHESELLGRNMHDMIHHTRPDGSHYPVAECRLFHSMQSLEDVNVSNEVFWRKDGTSFPVDYWSRPTMLNGESGAVITFLDITQSKLADASVRKLSLAVEQSPNSIVITDLHANIEFVNEAFTKATGYTFEEALGQNPRLLQSGKTPRETYIEMWDALTRGEKWEGEMINRSKDGTEYVESVRISPLRQADGRITHYVAVKEDVTQRKLAEEQIRNLAFYDVLTQLPNRRLLNDRLGQSMAASKRNGYYGALMFLDLDNFKILNDTHGHSVGDLLLTEAARRIVDCVRDSDTVARLGGDEFVVMLSELSKDESASAAQAAVVAEKIRHALSHPYQLSAKGIDGEPVSVEHNCPASIGVTLFIGHEVSQQDLLKRADTAMYQAKEAGRNQVCFFKAG